MEISKKLNRAVCISIALASLAVAGCKSSNPERTASGAYSDSRTTSHVKSALDKSPTYKYPGVNVSTFDGIVSLGGFVNTEAQKHEAADITRGVTGVRSVIDTIVVKPEPTGRAPVMGTNIKMNPDSMAPGFTNAAPITPQNP